MCKHFTSLWNLSSLISHFVSSGYNEKPILPRFDHMTLIFFALQYSDFTINYCRHIVYFYLCLIWAYYRLQLGTARVAFYLEGRRVTAVRGDGGRERTRAGTRPDHRIQTRTCRRTWRSRESPVEAHPSRQDSGSSGSHASYESRRRTVRGPSTSTASASSPCSACSGTTPGIQELSYTAIK